MDEQTISCSCGASGDVGEVIEHAVTALNGGDERVHDIGGGDPPEVAEAKARLQAKTDAQVALAAAAGLTIDQLRAALS